MKASESTLESEVALESGVVPGDRLESIHELEAEVGVLIRRIRRVIGHRARQVHPDLVPSTYLMLGFIRDNGPVRASEIGATFEIDKGGVSRQVQHLIDLGLVERSPDPEDGRATLLTATAEAVRRLELMAEARRAFLSERLGDWSEEELTTFVAEMRRYNAALAE